MADAEKQRRIMRQIAETTGWVCHYCGDQMPTFEEVRELFTIRQCWDEESRSWGTETVTTPTGPFYPTLDHKIPRAQGGSNAPENLVLCCFRCNAKKGSRYTYDEFLALMQGPAAGEAHNG